MKKLAVITTALALLLVTTAAPAKDMGGKFGVGYDQSLGGVSGLALTYWVTKSFGIDALLGFAIVAPDQGDTKFGLGVSLGARYNIARAKDVNLGIGVKVDLAFANKEMTNYNDDVFQANIAIPLTVEYFFSEHFAISLATGITLAIVPEDGNVLHPQGLGNVALAGKDFGVGFFNGGLFGQAGFRFYF